jgi:hypothetical protein
VGPTLQACRLGLGDEASINYQWIVHGGSMANSFHAL